MGSRLESRGGGRGDYHGRKVKRALDRPALDKPRGWTSERRRRMRDWAKLSKEDDRVHRRILGSQKSQVLPSRDRNVRYAREEKKQKNSQEARDGEEPAPRQIERKTS